MYGISCDGPRRRDGVERLLQVERHIVVQALTDARREIEMRAQPHPVFAEQIAVALVHAVVDVLLHVVVGNPRLGVADTGRHTAVFPPLFIVDLAQYRVGAALDEVVDADERRAGREAVVGI